MLFRKIHFKAHSILISFSNLKQEHPKSTEVSHQDGDKRIELKMSTRGLISGRMQSLTLNASNTAVRGHCNTNSPQISSIAKHMNIFLQNSQDFIKMLR